MYSMFACKISGNIMINQTFEVDLNPYGIGKCRVSFGEDLFSVLLSKLVFGLKSYGMHSTTLLHICY